MIKSMCAEMGRRIRERREIIGYTREEFAEKLDISVTFAADIELGKKGMSLDTLIKICELFSVSADYIIWGKGEHTENNLFDLLSGLDENEIGYAEDIIRSYVKAVSEVKLKNRCSGDLKLQQVDSESTVSDKNIK